MKVSTFILFILTLVSPFICLGIAYNIGEVDIFDTGGMIRYTWILYFSSLICLLSFSLGLIAKKKGFKYKRNIVSSCIVFCMSIILGSYWLIFSDTLDGTRNVISEVEKETGLYFPSDIESLTTYETSYYVCNAKICEDKDRFDNSLNDEKWMRYVPKLVETVLPDNYMYDKNTFDYFLFYDYETKEYNCLDISSSSSRCIFIEYSINNGHLRIMYDYYYF